MFRRTRTCAILLICGLMPFEGRPPRADDLQKPAGDAREKTSPAEKPGDVPRELVSGKVVLLTDALTRKKVKHYAEEIRNQVVLETAAGELLPILPDWRGRAFYQDERLRDRAVDLIVLRTPGVPHVRVQSIYTFDEQNVRQITDYWCDLCAIPMYEIKECECCQGPVRLRFRPQELPAAQTSKTHALKP